MKPYRAIGAIALLFSATFLFVNTRPSNAMPPFAQAYGESCDICHIAVPALNAYGRYVQRTGYSSLDAATIHRAIPVWVGINPFYESQNPDFPHKVQWGNVAIHGSGFLGNDWTYHYQQWLVSGNQPGFTDTLWATYNNLLHRDGHLTVGKLEDAAPSPYSMWYSLNGFGTLGMSSGEHSWAVGANRWGAKLVYSHNWFVAQGAYVGPSGNLNTATDFSSSTTDKSFDWLTAYAPPTIPYEVGFYGSQGTFPISNGTIDRYHGAAVYAQMDPMGRMPGVFTAYQVGHDPNPGPGLGATTPKAFTFDVFEPMFNQRVLIGGHQDFNDDGLGTLSHATVADFEWLAVREVNDRNVTGLILNAEAAMAPSSSPDWKAQLWYVTTIGPLH